MGESSDQKHTSLWCVVRTHTHNEPIFLKNLKKKKLGINKIMWETVGYLSPLEIWVRALDG